MDGGGGGRRPLTITAFIHFPRLTPSCIIEHMSRTEAVRRYASRLKFPKLLALVTILFIIDFLVPDPIPFIDEILMGLLAGLLGMWKKRRETEPDAIGSK